MAHIALFGTSADPPTLGHQAVLAWLTQQYGYVAIWAADNPFKQHGASLDQRTTMLQRAAEAVQASASPLLPRRLAVHPELSHPRTLITLQQAQQQWPQAQFTFVMGSDLVPQIPRWYAVETLLSQISLLIIPRSGYELDAADLNWLRDRTSITIAPIQGPAISSTDYRQHHSPVVHPSVQDYIQRQNLYSYSDALLEPTK